MEILQAQMEGLCRKPKRHEEATLRQAHGISKKQKHVANYSIATNMSRVVEKKDVLLIPESWLGAYMAYILKTKNAQRLWDYKHVINLRGRWEEHQQNYSLDCFKHTAHEF
jgi:hypothetical protein